MYTRGLTLAVFWMASALVHAQSTFPLLAGSGYTPPPGAATAAPGQILAVSVYGIRTIDPNVAIPSPTKPPYPPTSVGGISVTLVQQAQPQATPVPMFGIQQSTCNANDTNCRVVSTITLAIPSLLQAPTDNSNRASLQILEDGTPIGAIPLRPVTDNIHVITSCDQIPIYIGLFGEVAGVPGRCTALVQHLDGRLVTDRLPAKIGETITVWAYGLGAVDPTIHTDFNSPFTVQSPKLSFNPRANAPAIRPLLSDDVTHPLTSVLIGQQGLYQMNVILPSYLPAPTVACDELQVQSNFTITISGAASTDAAPICVSLQ